MKRKLGARLAQLSALTFILGLGLAVKRGLWTRFLSPSTRAFAREARRTPGYSRLDFVHGYVYGRWPYLYIGLGTGEHWLTRRFGAVLERLVTMLLPKTEGASSAQAWADSYHGKVMPLEAASQLVTIQEDVSLTNLEPIVPYARARDIVLQNPDHIVALECPCRAGRPNPCEPLDVCLVVGEPFASFVVEHQPARSRWITSREAVEILRAEEERGHVHHAFFKDAMLGRFYAICNCCACCCGAIGAHRSGTPMLVSSGYVARVDPELCIGCGVCAERCQFGALAIEDGTVVVEAPSCMGCGVCVSHCVQEALALARDPARGVPLEIHKLMAQATP